MIDRLVRWWSVLLIIWLVRVSEALHLPYGSRVEQLFFRCACDLAAVCLILLVTTRRKGE